MRLKPAMFLLAPAATLVLLGMSATARLNQPHKSVVDFARDVRPILSDKCFACHGPDDKHRLGGFRLDLREGAVKKATSGKSPIVPGKPHTSNLISRITTAGAMRMPPASTGKKLTGAEIETLKRWITQGAPYAEH